MSHVNSFASHDSDLFNAALAMPEAERAGFVARACQSDSVRRDRIEGLLRAHEESGEFLEASPAGRLHPSGQRVTGPIAAGDRIDRYRLLGKIGEGACGAVYLAAQEEPVRRRVALKVIKLGMDTKEVIARFEAERQALALMDHPNIARVLDAGTTSTGRPYFAMELVQGIAITDYCDHNRLSTGQRLQLFTQVCRAVQHAHQKGIIHRDLKPSNILVTLHDGEAVPKVIDFGIAKATQGRLTDRTVFTAFQQFIGTPAYMSPEQAELSNMDIDTRSDIYSLGVLLYELLTGRTPYDPDAFKAGLDEVRRVIRQVDPPLPSTRLNNLAEGDRISAALCRSSAPSQLSGQLKGDLDWIVMKALEKDRSRRYETVNGLMGDLQRHLQNEPVLARPPSAAYRLQKLVRRYKGPAAAAAAVLLALVAGTALSTWRFLAERRARERAVMAEQSESRERKRAEESMQTAEIARRLAESSMLQAESNRLAAEQARQNAEAERATAEKAKQEAMEAQRGAEKARHLEENARQRAEVAGAAALSAARDLSLNLYASDLFSVHTVLAQKGDSSTTQRVLRAHVPKPGEPDLRGVEWAYAWKRSQGDKLGFIPTRQGVVRDLTFSPDGTMFASAGRGEPGEQGHVRVWESATHRLLAEFIDTECVVFSADSRRLVTATRAGHIHIWKIPTWEQVGDFAAWPVEPAANRRVEIAIAPHAPHLAICADAIHGRAGGSVRVYNYETKAELAHFTDAGSRMAFLPNGKTLITGSTSRGTICAWDLASGARTRELRSPGYVSSLAVNPRGTLFAAYIPGKPGTVRLWQLSSWEPRRSFKCGDQDLLPGAVAFSPDSESIACGGGDRIVRVWKVESGRRVAEMRGAGTAVWALAFSSNGEHLYSGGRSDHISIWPATRSPAEQETYVTSLAPARAGIADVALRFSPDCKRLVTADWERMTTCDLGTAVVSTKRHGHHLPLWISADATALLALNQTRRTATRYDPVTIERDSVGTVAKAPFETLDLLDFPALTLRRTIPLPPEGPGVAVVSASMDGRKVALCWNGKAEVLIVDVETGVVTRRLTPRSPRPAAFAFSSDGRYLVLSGAGIYVEIWDLASTEPPAILAAHKSSIRHLVFSPDGDTFATWSLDQTHRLWSLSERRELAQFQDSDSVTQTQFSADGRTYWAATGSHLRIWHVATRRELGAFPLAGRASHFTLAPDEQTLAYCDQAPEERRLKSLQIPSRKAIDQQLMSASGTSAAGADRVRVPGASASALDDEGIEPSATDIAAP